MSFRVRTWIAVLALGTIWAQSARTQTPAGPPAGGAVILNDYSSWRIFQTLCPPLMGPGGQAKPLATSRPWLNADTPAPPGDWQKVDFDDGAWLRGTARLFARTPYLSRLFLRGRFEVTDPAKVKDLRLSLRYQGGAVVYLNGAELARGNLPAGPASLAEDYPQGAFVGDDGKLIPTAWFTRDRWPKNVALRERELREVSLPADRLRKGLNVLAIQIVRAPYNEVVDKLKGVGVSPRELGDRGTPYDLPWNTCELLEVTLKAASPDGLVGNAERPKGLQVWNQDLLAADYDTDMGDRFEALRPVRIVAARNGSYSGKLVVGSSEPIRGLKVLVQDLKGPGGAASAGPGQGIPASAVRVRYGWPFGQIEDLTDARPRSAVLLEGLLESPLPEFPLGANRSAVVPLWFTVAVPKDARPGEYTGAVTIQAQGAPPVQASLSLSVADWALPDPQDFRTWVEMVQSPETLAKEYNVPLWSDRHWELIARSLHYMGQTGSRVVHVPLICHTNFGNEESMVRWVRRPDGTYGYDFSILDKYLDLAAREMGQPKLVVFTAWEVYLQPPKGEVVMDPNWSSYVKMERSWDAARWELRDKGPAVTATDDAGKAQIVYLPRYEDPASKALWKPLFDELHQRMAQRGWEKTMALGMLSDRWPNKQEATFLNEVSGDLPWVCHTHGGSRVGQKVQGIGEVSYIAYVWNCEYPTDPSEGRTYGWKRPELYAQYERFGALNVWPAASLRHFAEFNIAGMQRGVGRVGADFWPIVRDKQGRRVGRLWSGQLESRWHSLDLSSYLLDPGPDGPVASTRFEAFRQGVQDCEARIFIEAALTDEAARGRLGEDLAQRCRKALDDRIRFMTRGSSSLALTGRSYATMRGSKYAIGGVSGHYWYLGAGWQQQAQELYDLAAGVAAKRAP